MLVAVPLGLGASIYLSEYAAARTEDDQADRRAARRHPDDRVRLLRAHLFHPGDPARRLRERRSGSSTGSPPASSWASSPSRRRVDRRGCDAAVPQSLARVPSASAARSSRSRPGGVPRRAIGDRRRVVLGCPGRGRDDGGAHRGRAGAAVGSERGFKPMETMTAFIGATGKGDVSTGSTAYKTIFAVGIDALRDHADHEHDLDSLRAQVQAGVRVSADGQRADPAGAPATARREGRRLPVGSACLLAIAIVLLASSSWDVVETGGHARPRLHHELHLDHRRSGRDPGGALGHDLDHGRLRPLHRVRSASQPRSTSRSTRTTTAGTTG